MLKRCAFTLAEVLITLGIIGVVAALTIPALISNYQEKSFVTQFQKAYSELSQAYMQSVQENGTADKWASPLEAYNNIKPFLKTIKDCQYPSTSTQKDCYRSYLTKGLVSNTDSTYASPNLILSNGASIEFDTDIGLLLIWLDTNGKKGPNRLGYDYFYLQLATKNNSPVLSWAYNGYGMVESYSNYCRKTAAVGGWIDGGSCAYWLIKNGNMDYLHRDIPDAEWKQ